MWIIKKRTFQEKRVGQTEEKALKQEYLWCVLGASTKPEGLGKLEEEYWEMKWEN